MRDEERNYKQRKDTLKQLERDFVPACMFLCLHVEVMEVVKAEDTLGLTLLEWAETIFSWLNVHLQSELSEEDAGNGAAEEEGSQTSVAIPDLVALLNGSLDMAGLSFRELVELGTGLTELLVLEPADATAEETTQLSLSQAMLPQVAGLVAH